MNSFRKIILHNLGLLVIFFGAVFALGFAFFAQYHDGYHPCELCLVQRWIYGAAIVAVFPAHARIVRVQSFVNVASVILCLILALEVGVAAYHFGIEQKWWEGFMACSSGLESGLSMEQLRAQVNAAPVTRCDQATWYFLGLSMAGWNVIYSFGLLVVSVLAIIVLRAGTEQSEAKQTARRKAARGA